MKIHYCDRCGKEINKNKDISWFRRKIHYSKVAFSCCQNLDYDDRCMEFCPDCTMKFENWMEFGKNPRGDIE